MCNVALIRSLLQSVFVRFLQHWMDPFFLDEEGISPSLDQCTITPLRTLEDRLGPFGWAGSEFLDHKDMLWDNLTHFDDESRALLFGRSNPSTKEPDPTAFMDDLAFSLNDAFSLPAYPTNDYRAAKSPQRVSSLTSEEKVSLSERKSNMQIDARLLEDEGTLFPLEPTDFALMKQSVFQSVSSSIYLPRPMSKSCPLSNSPGTSPDRRDRRKNRVKIACVPCHSSKVMCDEGRPCKRCVRNGMEEQCVSRTHRRMGRPPKRKARP